LPLPSDPELGAGNFAVVTGNYDRMQDILAKLGMGELDEYHELVPCSETFDIYDGNYSFSGEYPVFTELFENDGLTGDPLIYNYDMVFINCGNSYEYDFFLDESKMAILRDYVAGGKKLYVTDWSYDFVEQIFPEYIDFYGSDETAETGKEETNAAQVGDWGITSDATINDAQMKAWLQTVLCQEGNCLNPDMTIHIAGFWSGWVVINGAHASKASSVKIWVTGPVSWYDWYLEDPEGSGIKPLTVSFVHGLGRVLYTSYHTEEDNPSAGFWPQERVLQYLVLEL
jgi:hypothetical protein